MTVGANFKIALISEQPIPDEPPVTMITDVRSKYSEGVGILGLIGANTFDRIDQSCVGSFFAYLSQSGGVNRLR